MRQELILRLDGVYKFVHDRIQEAAYSLIPADSRAAAHLRIGRVLAAHTPQEKREEAIFEIVNQLNRGVALITAPEEREQLAELNLVAGRRAKASTAYASALTYLVAGAALLPEDAWEHRHELIFALELERAECEFLTGALAEAEQRLAMLSTCAATTLERATVACLRVDLYTTLDRSSRAIAVGLDYLRHLGIDWSPHPTDEEARREYEQIWSQLGSRTIEALTDLTLMSDPASLATMDVLTKLGPPSMYTDANLLALVTCRAVNLSLEYGNCDASCPAYALRGIVAGPRYGDYQEAYRFGQLGYDLVEGRGLIGFQARVYMNFGDVVLPWTRHIRAGRDLLRRAFEVANKIGDLTYAAYCGVTLNANLLAAGDPLAEVQREAEHGLAFARRARFGLVIDIIETQLGLIRTLRGLTPTFGSFDDARFDERRIERRFSENPELAFVECWYWMRRRASLPAIMRRRSRPRRGRNGFCRHRHRCPKRPTIISSAPLPKRHAARPHRPGSGNSIWTLSLRIISTSSSGRRIAPTISRTVPHWSAPRSRASKVANSMPNTSTNGRFPLPGTMVLSTMRRSLARWPRAFTRCMASR